ncbi:uncharacterized protein LOC130253996 isoform X6 [Oenanthe melanoleuca]|uniref:uncharacterized protein LOC130253996 isoform X6 n=1 Tax=Oenanthe melanoleuca TaxID=2939378 RepID=UPI0024C1397C|nr:uncharacterized protein LOC130253996 isoform X6 [Oenanthe melanoleuca]
MPSLPQDSPAGGLGTGFPMVRGPPSELMGFYITSYEAAFGKRPTGSPQTLEGRRALGIEPPSDRSMHPLLGVHTGSGYVANNYAEAASVVFPYVERQDTDVSTTSEDFKIFGRPDYQRLLPSYADELECRYPAGFSFSRLRFGEVTAPKVSRENDTWSPHTSPAQPDVPQRTTELSGFTRTDPRSDLTLPEQPPQPAMGHPAPFAPPELQVAPKGVTTEQEPLTYSTVQNKYLTKFTPLAPVAPGWWAQTPVTWAPRSVEGIQIPSPSGFSTNNHPTKLWHIDKTLM